MKNNRTLGLGSVMIETELMQQAKLMSETNLRPKLMLACNKTRDNKCWKENKQEQYLQVMAKVHNG